MQKSECSLSCVVPLKQNIDCKEKEDRFRVTMTLIVFTYSTRPESLEGICVHVIRRNSYIVAHHKHSLLEPPCELLFHVGFVRKKQKNVGVVLRMQERFRYGKLIQRISIFSKDTHLYLSLGQVGIRQQ